nr:MAG TPA: hypothetical protein [Herelleviridae sp.]DAZ67012.1 MAG TPA: hypothetical protein [Caudoviricetes sp.]
MGCYIANSSLKCYFTIPYHQNTTKRKGVKTYYNGGKRW